MDGRLEKLKILNNDTKESFFVLFNPVTNTSVLCAERKPKTPSLLLSLPAVTRSDFAAVHNSLPLIEHETLSPLTDKAMSCSTASHFETFGATRSRAPSLMCPRRFEANSNS